MKTIQCPKCEKGWDYTSGQAVAVRLFGECIVCNPRLSSDELDQIRRIARNRSLER